MKTRVQELLSRKGSHVVTAHAGETVSEVAHSMVNHGVGSVIVTDEDTVLGVFSERDCMKEVVLRGRNPTTTACGEVMHTAGPHAQIEHTVEQCMSLMARHGRQHLPVVHSGALVGVVSLRDCAAHLSREATHEAEELREYVSGSYPPDSWRSAKHD
jgi:CBS domain-containing protein